MRKAQGFLWLIVTATSLMVVCVGHVLEAFVPPSSAGAADRPGSEAMAETLSSLAQPAGGAPSPEALLPASDAESDTKTLRREGQVVLTVVYDNHSSDSRLTSAWGFACLVETSSGGVLFDTGGDGRILLANLEALGIDARRIDAVVLSHIHTDHVGGLEALLSVNDDLAVYLPRSFPRAFIAGISDRARVVEVEGPVEVVPGMRTTGEMGTSIVEQALIVKTARGLVVLTGCAHPGVTEYVRHAHEQGKVHLVMGGFHLEGASSEAVKLVIERFEALRVERVAPCHCTGVEAIAAFAEAFGSNFIDAGVGTRILIES